MVWKQQILCSSCGVSPQSSPFTACHQVWAPRCMSSPQEKQMLSPSSQASKCTKHSHVHSHRHAVCYKRTHLSLSFASFLDLLEDCFPGLGVAVAAAAAVPAPAAARPAPAPLSASSPSPGSCWPCCTDGLEMDRT